jgi:GT2 family glycosyltransferase
MVRVRVRACAGHPALLCYAIGNEIPAPIVRWLGRRCVERYIERLYWAVKAEDPDALVTYVNYPSTEYLHLPFLDLVCFNVYLEAPESFEAYLARLHNIAADRPLIMSEIGLDSLRHGEETQADALDWQVRTAFAGGCAGVFVFAWTDEWFRASAEVDDWAFGLTDRDRRPKPALATVHRAFAEVPFPADLPWPRVSVAVCSYNGARTIRDCFEGLRQLDYPNFEVIVVDDGSTDGTAAIAREYGFRVVSRENRGLGAARNTGMEEATGEIIAYIDDDARPDRHWLTHLVATFMGGDYAAVGGPNVAPPGAGPVAECVANAPGCPMHVLLSDREAEHIPGCNMAFRKACLEAVGGFDRQFRTAGDDVDVCWQLQQHGWRVGFSPAAMVWHHRRSSLRAYWKQQRGYGEAEALLERKWPEKYNAAGHHGWTGRIYGRGVAPILGPGERIRYGVWGSAPFQSVYQPTPGTLWSLPLMPEWYLVVGTLAALSALGALWTPLLLALPLLVLTTAAPFAQAVLGAAQASFASAPRPRVARLKLRCFVACLYLLQPLARLWGRLRRGLTPWRQRGVPGFALPRPRAIAIWSERWQDPSERVRSVETALRADGAIWRRGGDYDRWDLEVRRGMLGAARMLMAVEEHGAGKQLVRARVWPRCSPNWLALILVLVALSAGMALGGAPGVGVLLGAQAVLLALGAFRECAAATAGLVRTLQRLRDPSEDRLAREAITTTPVLELGTPGARATRERIV